MFLLVSGLLGSFGLDCPIGFLSYLWLWAGQPCGLSGVAGFGLVFFGWLWAGSPGLIVFALGWTALCFVTDFGLGSPVSFGWLWAGQPCVLLLALGWTALCFFVGFGLDSPVFRFWLWAGQPCVFWLALGWTVGLFCICGLDSPFTLVGWIAFSNLWAG